MRVGPTVCTFSSRAAHGPAMRFTGSRGRERKTFTVASTHGRCWFSRRRCRESPCRLLMFARLCVSLVYWKWSELVMTLSLLIATQKAVQGPALNKLMNASPESATSGNNRQTVPYSRVGATSSCDAKCLPLLCASVVSCDQGFAKRKSTLAVPFHPANPNGQE